MDDDKIIEMFFKRDEKALAHTEDKYSLYCRSVAAHILNSKEDTEEALNDTWLAAWNAIPPHKPEHLKTFLAKLTRNISLNKVRSDKALKRGSAEVRVVFEEIEEWLTAEDDTECKISEQVTADSINDFLAGISETERNVFVRRYWYMQPISEIAEYHGFSESKVKSMLFRLRKRLYAKMKKEGLI